MRLWVFRDTKYLYAFTRRKMLSYTHTVLEPSKLFPNYLLDLTADNKHRLCLTRLKSLTGRAINLV